ECPRPRGGGACLPGGGRGGGRASGWGCCRSWVLSNRCFSRAARLPDHIPPIEYRKRRPLAPQPSPDGRRGPGRFDAVTRRLLLIPGAPLLVPELSGADEGAAQVRAAVLSAARRVLGDGAGSGAGRSRPLIVRRPDD